MSSELVILFVLLLLVIGEFATFIAIAHLIKHIKNQINLRK